MLAEQRRWLVGDRPMAETKKLNLHQQNVETGKRATKKFAAIWTIKVLSFFSVISSLLTTKKFGI
jgi:hypothetical protein